MIRASHSPSVSPRPATLQPAGPAPAGGPAYGRPFWLAYAANILVMVAVSLLFRYADFVAALGGSEWELGWIVGTGMVGSLAVRLTLGTWIDQYGPRRVWLAALGLLGASCLAHLAVGTCHGPAIYLLRIAYCCAIAGVFGASMTFISARVPPTRTAEMIGMLGTAGFLGMVIGTQLGDLLLGTAVIHRWQIDAMFVAAAVLAGGSAGFALLATRELPVPRRAGRPPLWRLIGQYNPGPVLLVGLGMGIGLTLPGNFLRPYAAQLNVPRIGLFFGVYAPTAFVTRVLTRRLPERYGPEPMILLGLTGVVGGLLLLLVVGSQWHLVFPGLVFGVSHAMLFPSVVALGARRFPVEHRGLGTTLMLGTWDAGQLVGAPLVGGLLTTSARAGLPPYPTTFVSIAALLALLGVLYAALSSRRRVEPSPQPDHEEQSVAGPQPVAEELAARE